ncbi:hypothetical protein [Candidatus Methylobacter oryzae]|uniref:hypothetical protein n=1 Tax=Candidatus Methylobacter oryzae TaxID=2497749 RepID=UPI001F5002BB|nr:hypothetical protein [Candidatus Methylobacter oryzae]
MVDELLDNRHKALVFSQFVGHLALIRELLDKKASPIITWTAQPRRRNGKKP